MLHQYKYFFGQNGRFELIWWQKGRCLVGQNSSLEKLLGCSDVLLEEKIVALIEAAIPGPRFVVLGQTLINKASSEEKTRCSEQVSALTSLMRLQKKRLWSGN